MVSAKSLIKKFDLKKHPEGGYFKESYRSSEVILRRALPSRYKGDRNFSTSIYYLLPVGEVSRLHRLVSDEVWHFHHGLLGPDVAAGQKVQHTVPAGYWFGARPAGDSAYSFVGCTVAPGFDFSDSEPADAKSLSRVFPALREKILLFTKAD
jgi:uncharacterized protein